MARVLVVDDEPRIRAALRRGLTAHGLEVVLAADGPSGLSAARSGLFDVILMDIILPALSGYRVLERLRAMGVDTPVLVISAKDGEVDRADGFDLGADGYMVKPFSFRVLLAQVSALLRRRELGVAYSPGRLRLGELIVDPVMRQVSRSGRTVHLTRREFALLYELARRPDTVVSKQELLRLAWGGEHATSPNLVEVYVGYLRRKLDVLGAAHLLGTVRCQGYTLKESGAESPEAS